jgi:hypothetical protein
MKNIHVLPTDKPSRVYKIRLTQNLQLLEKTYLTSSDSLVITQNIYITSDEEIKEGDWFTDDNNSLKRSYKLSHVQFANPKKIILTTDQDLIKDGVQPIPDEFLEWFVKNPSCEEVDFVFNNRGITGTEKILKTFGEYEIIIPKEEPKEQEMYSDKDIINALHSLELKDNKNYSKIYNGMKEFIKQSKNK